MDCLFSVGSGRRSRIELEAAGLGFGNRSFSNHADPGTRAADPDLHCSDSNRRRQALKDQMSFEGTLTKTVRYRSVFQESVQRPRGVLREPISLSVTCYSFYKVSTHFFNAALLPHLGTYHALGCGFHLSLFCFRFHSHEETSEKTEIA